MSNEMPTIRAERPGSSAMRWPPIRSQCWLPSG
jgi:hypothetical protein